MKAQRKSVTIWSQIQSLSTTLLLVHAADEVIELELSVSVVSTLDVMKALLDEATAWGAKLEGPQEVVGLLEVGTHIVNLVDQVLNADDAKLTELLQIQKQHC